MNGFIKKGGLAFGLDASVHDGSGRRAAGGRSRRRGGASFWTRPRLTGDWFGLRDDLGKKGVVLDVDLLQTPQGVIDRRYATRGREVLGPGRVHAQRRHGEARALAGRLPQRHGDEQLRENVNKASGAPVPMHTSPAPARRAGEADHRPHEPDVHAVLQQAVRASSWASCTRSAVDDNEFAHDYHSTFLNSAFNFNMTLALFPFTAYGGGFVILPWDGAVVHAERRRPERHARQNNDISDAFQDGRARERPRAGSPSSPSAWSATSSWASCGATRSASRSSRIRPTSPGCS